MKFRLILILIIPLLLIEACDQVEQKTVDTLIVNANIYTSDSSFTKVEAVAIHDGIVVETGSSKDLDKKYSSANRLDLEGKTVVPGLIDAHCHFLAYGIDENELSLKQCSSFDNMIDMVISYAQEKERDWIIGRGWNEENWVSKTRPSKTKLDILFPNTPVVLQRVDGHAVLANQSALDLAGISESTVIPGGEIVQINGYLTGMLVDQAANKMLSFVPKPTKSQKIDAILKAQSNCINKGLVCVSDAGLSVEDIQLIDSLHESGDLKIRVYAMASPDQESLEPIFESGPILKDRLVFRSVKIYADGALGSRGALLKEEYCDDPGNYGLIQEDMEYFEKWASICSENGFQMNTHCIGDSANALILKLYSEHLDTKNERWRIEHAQVVSPEDMHYFTDYGIIPSVQPTHAVSDMYMAKSRLCEDDRLIGAYAYRTLLNECGILAYGTDFPVEGIDPLDTYYASLQRKNEKRDVFRQEETVDAFSSLKAMTIWAAYANFMDEKCGSIEAGKFADLTILDKNLINHLDRRSIHVVGTMIQGELLFDSL